jgi:hypothetical protein
MIEFAIVSSRMFVVCKVRFPVTIHNSSEVNRFSAIGAEKIAFNARKERGI